MSRLFQSRLVRSVRKTLAPIRNRLVRVETSRPYRIVIDGNRRELDGQVAVVTGGSGAIGRAICVRLASEGAKVHVLGRDVERIDAVVDEIRALGGSAVPGRVNVADAREIDAYLEAVGQIDILVNNAGGSSRERHAPLWEQSVEVIDEVLSVNLRAAMLCTRRAGRSMVAQATGGRVILIGSTVGVGGKARFSDYAAAKSALGGYAKSAAIELGPYGVTVNCVSPGIIQRDTPTAHQLNAVRAKAVLPREGRVEDVAELVMFLVSPRGGYITGQNIVLDGGRSLGLRGD